MPLAATTGGAKQRYISYEIWHPLAHWIKQLQWTTLTINGDSPQVRRRRSATWTELAITFQLQTGHDIIGVKTALSEQVSCFRKAFGHILLPCTTEGSKRNKIVNLSLGLSTRTTSAKALTGQDMPGIRRRPILP